MTTKLMGKKIGMTKRFKEDGSAIPCTVIEVEPNVVTQIKTKETDGYDAVQISAVLVEVKDERTMARRMTKPLLGHQKKAGVAPRKYALEFTVDNPGDFELGQELTLDVLEGIKWVDVSGISKGKGFQGVMKRYGFAGGPASHGSGFHRSMGSTGMRSTPGRCFPGSPRPTRMGGNKVTLQRLGVVAVETVECQGKKKTVLLVKGAIPGANGELVLIQRSIKTKK